MRNLLLIGTAALAVALTGTAAYAEPAENQVSTSAYIGGAQSPDLSANPVISEGRSAYVVTDGGAPSASLRDRSSPDVR